MSAEAEDDPPYQVSDGSSDEEGDPVVRTMGAKKNRDEEDKKRAEIASRLMTEDKRREREEDASFREQVELDAIHNRTTRGDKTRIEKRREIAEIAGSSKFKEISKTAKKLQSNLRL